MPARRAYLASIASVSATAVAGCSGFGGIGQVNTTTQNAATNEAATETLVVSTETFQDGESIPTRYTCDGEDASPPISPEIPDVAETWALVMTDPDAPGTTFTHWLIWNIPGDRSLPEGVPTEETVSDLDDAAQGTNDFGDVGYGGPCPPEGDGPHTYVFDVYALDDSLGLDPGAKRDAVESAIAESDALVATGTIEGQYER